MALCLIATQRAFSGRGRCEDGCFRKVSVCRHGPHHSANIVLCRGGQAWAGLSSGTTDKMNDSVKPWNLSRQRHPAHLSTPDAVQPVYTVSLA